MNNKWFQTATPESVGISSASVKRLVDTMCNHKEFRENHGFMIIRKKKIIAQGYFAPYKDEQHVIHSCSKAFTATAIGFAAQEGLLSVDDFVADYFPEFLPENPHPNMLKLTIRHLLIMSNGHSRNVFKRPYGEISPEQLLRDFFSVDYKCDPGEKFSYNNTNTYVLSAIIKKVTGLDPIDYLRPRLLDKLGINPFYYTDDNGMFVGFGTMRLTLEELARFGQFYMDGCVWEGEQLLSKEWAALATQKHIENAKADRNGDWDQGYAFQMWRGKHNSFRFCGAFGQICAVYPDHDMMFLVNSGSDEEIQKELDSFYDNVLTNISDKLPENTDEFNNLKSYCESLSLPAIFSKPSPFINRINGKTFALSDCGEIISAKLDFSTEACHVLLNFKNGSCFEFDAGLKDFAYTDCPDTHVVSLQPKDDAKCVATGYWKEMNEFKVTAHMVPTQTMFTLNFDFSCDALTLSVGYGRAYEFGTR